MSVDIGTMMVLRNYDELRSAGQCLRENLISDHLLLFSYIDFSPMSSIRQPRIDKVSIVSKAFGMSKQEINDFRKNFTEEFLRLRNNCI